MNMHIANFLRIFIVAILAVAAGAWIATSSAQVREPTNNIFGDAPRVFAVPQGGTGWANIQANTLLTGNGSSRLATTSIGSGLSLSGGVLSASLSAPGLDPFTHPAANQSATTSLMLFNGGASTTNLSVFNKLFVGGSATTTIDSTGFVTMPNGFLSQASSTIVGTSTFDGRPLFSIGSATTTLTVCSSGCMFTTIQNAVNSLPHFIFSRRYIIDVGAGTYPEDVLIQNIQGDRIIDGAEYTGFVWLRGSTTAPTSVKINSVLGENIQGSWLNISGFEIQGSNPYTNESAGVEFYAAYTAVLGNSVFSGGDNGIVCYASLCSVNGTVDFGSSVLTGNGVVVKHNGQIFLGGSGTSITGNVQGFAFEPQAGTINFESSRVSLTGTLGFIFNTDTLGTGGEVRDYTTKSYYHTDSVMPSNSNGYFGIGTTAPQSILHLNNDSSKIIFGGRYQNDFLSISRDNSNKRLIFNAPYDAAGNAGFIFNTDDGGSGATSNFIFTGSSDEIFKITSVNDGDQSSLTFSDDNLVKFKVATNGNIGIASSTPWAFLSLEPLSTNTAPLFSISTSTATATSTAFHINSNGLLGIASSSPGSLLSIGNLANFTFATSTFYSSGGLNLTGGGCFAVNGTCLLTSASGANPTGTIGLSVVNGSATTFLRSDAAPALDQSIAPTWTGLHAFSNSGTTTFSGGIESGVAIAAPYFMATSTTGTTTIATGQGFTVGSTQLVVQQGSGNVGIGTSTLISRLNIEGTNNSTGGITLSSSAGTQNNRLQIYPNGNTSVTFQNIANGDTSFTDSSNNSRFIINNSTTRVGVGDSSPDSKFEIQTSSGNGYLAITNSSDGDILVVNSSGFLGLGTTTPKWGLTASNNTIPQIALTDTTSSSNAWTFRSKADTLYIATSTATATSSVPAITINPNGLTGIATSSPGSLFSIQGVANFVGGATSTLYNGFKIAAGGLSVDTLTSADCDVKSNGGILYCGTDSAGAGSFPFTTTNYGVSTSTIVGFTNGLMSMASSTFTQSLWASVQFGIATSTTDKNHGVGFNVATSTSFWYNVGFHYASSTSAAAEKLINWNDGATQRHILSANTNFTINSTSSNPIDGMRGVIKVCQDSVGSRTLTFTSIALRWANGTTTISSTANTCSMIGMVYDELYGIYNVVASSTNMKIN